MTSTLNQQQSQPAPKSLTSAITDDDRKRIERLFLRFAAIYGHVWKSNYKSEQLLEVTKEEWAVNLKPFNNQIIKEVLIDCTLHLNLPPTLPQFIGKCTTIEKRNSGYFTKHVSTKTTCSEIAEFNLKQMRNILLK